MNKLGDDLYQRLHGFKSVKRSHKKQGQSDWYYLNPRYDTDGDPRGEIDGRNYTRPSEKKMFLVKTELLKMLTDLMLEKNAMIGLKKWRT